MTIRTRLLYRDRGDHLSFRDASVYVHDPRDLDANGKPPPWMRDATPIEADPEEVEFDHPPTEAELKAAFPQFYKPKKRK